MKSAAYRFLNGTMFFRAPDGADGGGGDGNNTGAPASGTPSGAPAAGILGSTTPAQGAPAAGAADWKEYTPDPAKSEADNATAKAAHDATKPQAQAKPEIGKDPAKSPEQNAADLQADIAKRLEDIKTWEIKVPDGFEADPAQRAEFEPIIAKHRLSKEAAQDLVNLEGKLRNDAYQKHWEIAGKEWPAKAAADPEFGGASFDANVLVANKAIKEFGTPEFIKLLTDTGYSNHPEMIRFCYRAGKAMGEGRAVNGQGGSGAQEKGPPAAAVLYDHPSSNAK
jgi:hypothetical protein